MCLFVLSSFELVKGLSFRGDVSRSAKEHGKAILQSTIGQTVWPAGMERLVLLEDSPALDSRSRQRGEGQGRGPLTRLDAASQKRRANGALTCPAPLARVVGWHR